MPSIRISTISHTFELIVVVREHIVTYVVTSPGQVVTAMTDVGMELLRIALSVVAPVVAHLLAPVLAKVLHVATQVILIPIESVEQVSHVYLVLVYKFGFDVLEK